MLQKWPFFQLFFLGNIGQPNVFYDILERKNVFLGYKNKKLKKSKNWHFSKGVTHGFGPKMAVFLSFFFRQERPGKCLLRYSRTKKDLSRVSNKKLKKSKNWHCSKGVTHGFGPIIAIFATFLFRQYKPGKGLLRYSRTKKRACRL